MERLGTTLMTTGAAIFGGFSILKTFFFTVEPGERAVIFDKFSGIKDTVKGEGLHFYIPFIQVSPQYFLWVA
jgi:prohibitin 1